MADTKQECQFERLEIEFNKENQTMSLSLGGGDLKQTMTISLNEAAQLCDVMKKGIEDNFSLSE